MVLAKTDLSFARRYAGLVAEGQTREPIFRRIADEYWDTMAARQAILGPRELSANDRLLKQSIETACPISTLSITGRRSC